MCSQKQDEEKKNPLLSNTNALNQARPTLQAMVFTGVFEELVTSTICSIFFIFSYLWWNLSKLQQQKSITFTVIKKQKNKQCWPSWVNKKRWCK